MNTLRIILAALAVSCMGLSTTATADHRDGYRTDRGQTYQRQSRRDHRLSHRRDWNRSHWRRPHGYRHQRRAERHWRRGYQRHGCRHRPGWRRDAGPRHRRHDPPYYRPHYYRPRTGITLWFDGVGLSYSDRY